MPSRRTPCTRQFAILAVLLTVLCIPSTSLIAKSQTSDKKDADDRAPFKLKIETNLVVVRAVVRDAQGHPVQGLKKEDFKLFDRGKEQPILQFEEESAADAPPSSSTAQPQEQSAAPPAPAPPERFIAIYFDDLNMSDADVIQARDAADKYLGASIHPRDSVAIFTPEKVLTDFTSDPKQMHEALSHLRMSSNAANRAHGCPDISDYQAQELLSTNDVDSNAWRAVWAEARTCAVRNFPTSQDPSAPYPDSNSMRGIRMIARDILSRAQDVASTDLKQLAQVVDFVAKAPGQRTVVLVSAGFLSQEEQHSLDQTIDRAVRSQVVINSLNPRGLVVMTREADASRGNALADPRAAQSRNMLASEREFVANDVLAEAAQGTGGQFFHDDNDLKAGFEALAGHPANYVLTFTPSELKLDGKFHDLKVTLAEKHKGYTVVARRGYFAVAEATAAAPQPPHPGNRPETGAKVPQPAAPNPAPAAEAKQRKAPTAEEKEQQQIQIALRSKTESADLPVELEASPSEGEGETRLLAVTLHLDTKTLHLRQQSGHNLNALTFAFAIFDDKDNVVQVKQRRANIDLLDDQLPDFVKDGLDMNAMLEVKPGTYRLRVVVIDSEEHRLGSATHTVSVP